jgi:hypothetical protein
VPHTPPHAPPARKPKNICGLTARRHHCHPSHPRIRLPTRSLGLNSFHLCSPRLTPNISWCTPKPKTNPRTPVTPQRKGLTHCPYKTGPRTPGLTLTSSNTTHPKSQTPPDAFHYQIPTLIKSNKIRSYTRNHLPQPCLPKRPLPSPCPSHAAGARSSRTRPSHRTSRSVSPRRWT